MQSLVREHQQHLSLLFFLLQKGVIFKFIRNQCCLKILLNVWVILSTYVRLVGQKYKSLLITLCTATTAKQQLSAPQPPAALALRASRAALTHTYIR